MSGNSSIKIGSIQVKVWPDTTDYAVGWSNVTSNTVLIPISNFYGNTTLTVKDMVITDRITPANSTQNTISGQIWSDGTYLYVGTPNNVIKRITLETF